MPKPAGVQVECLTPDWDQEVPGVGVIREFEGEVHNQLRVPVAPAQGPPLAFRVPTLTQQN